MISDIKLSPEFKAQTTKAIVSIILFVLTYIALMGFALGLTVFCLYGAFLIITTYISGLSIALSIGLASLGFLVLIFLVKFIFKSHKVDRSHLMEVYRKDEPDLFQLIDEIVKQVDTSFPKKVYLSADVNAAVFYDSSFWSMFFPIRKNLQIGLGLVNSVSKEEFKAILSHEFGHFSQESMKVGSYVYNVNQVIYNMLYDNQGYDGFITSFANAGWFFELFAIVAIKIIAFIQWVLGKMYGVVNKSYMSLSREMEFHADEIAANVTGYEPLKTSLLRLEMANHAYNYVLATYDDLIIKNFKSENLYKEHTFVMNHLAIDGAIQIENGLPKVSVEDLNKYNKSKLIIKDQWASHPSTEERIMRLEKLNIQANGTVFEPANTVFSNIEQLQKTLTEKIFSSVKFEGESELMGLSNFQAAFETQFLSNTFAKLYQGYYDNKNPSPFDIESQKGKTSSILFDDLYNAEKIDLVYSLVALETDLLTLNQIANKEIDVKTFDYDGKKYNRKESKKLIANLESEKNKLSDLVKQNDVDVFKYFYSIAQGEEANLLVQKYQKLLDYEQESADKFELCTNLSQGLSFLNHSITYEAAVHNFGTMEPVEKRLKLAIQDIMEDPSFQTEISKPMQDNFEKYLSRKWTYIGVDSLFQKNLEMLFAALNDYAHLLSRGFFLKKKEVLAFQKELQERA